MQRSLLLLLVLLSPCSLAEQVYVIDRLLIGVHESANQDSAVLGVIPSGTALEVLERDGDWARVSGPNSLEGWVDAGYVAPERPAKLVVNELENTIESLRQQLQQAGTAAANTAPATATPVAAEQSDELRKKLESVRQELASERLKVAELKARQGQSREQGERIAELEQKLLQQQQTSESLQQQLTEANAMQISRIDGIDFIAVLKHHYTQIAAVVLLLLGLVAGIWFMDWRNRARHGGFRI